MPQDMTAGSKQRVAHCSPALPWGAAVAVVLSQILLLASKTSPDEEPEPLTKKPARPVVKSKSTGRPKKKMLLRRNQRKRASRWAIRHKRKDPMSDNNAGEWPGRREVFHELMTPIKAAMFVRLDQTGHTSEVLAGHKLSTE